MYISEDKNCQGLYLKQALYSCLNKNLAHSNLQTQNFLNKHEVNFDDYFRWPIQELQKTSLKPVCPCFVLFRNKFKPAIFSQTGGFIK